MMFRSTIPLVVAMLLYCTMVSFAQSEPLTVRIADGEAVTLKASSATANSFQWMKNGTNIVNATQSTYTVKEAGLYTVISFAGGCPSDVSDPVRVILAAPIPSSGSADLAVMKTAESRAVVVNEAFDYTLKVQNNGPDAASQVVVTDPLPQSLAFQQLLQPTIGTARYDLVSKTIIWEISQMRAGDVANLTLRVKALEGGEIRNSAIVKALEADPQSSNNIAVHLKSVLAIKVPNVFTPNGDGKNDSFEIAGLQHFSSNQLRIMNRWGSSVYEKDNYNNDWTGSGLSSGTYFYVLRIKNANSDWQEFKGYVTIIR